MVKTETERIEDPAVAVAAGAGVDGFSLVRGFASFAQIKPW
jgi:hypothetical protein